MAEGADFILIGATYTMLRSKKPVVAVCAVRTGSGKSQTTRKVCEIVQRFEKKVVVVRHPMPYGDLRAQVMQRFSSYEDFARHHCTLEEREEYEPLVEKGIIVYAGIDYGLILEAAEGEADVIVWDGGNNDTPFYFPDVHIVLFDPHRAGHELTYYPGETNMLMADITVINKVDTASPASVEQVRKNIEQHAPRATIVLAESPVLVNEPDLIRGARVLVVEDGPTLTHGECRTAPVSLPPASMVRQRSSIPVPMHPGRLQKPIACTPISARCSPPWVTVTIKSTTWNVLSTGRIVTLSFSPRLSS